MSFTPQQSALISEAGHALALAGPGSGKTSTIIEKIARILQSPGNQVVACSFTREGAEEIRRRLQKRIGQEALETADIRIGTFHSIVAEHRKSMGRAPRMISPALQMRTLASAAASAGTTLANVLYEFEEIKHSLIPPNPDSLPDWFLSYEKHLKTLSSIDLQDLIRKSVLQMALSVKLPDIPPNVDYDNSPMPVKLAMAAARYKSDLQARLARLKREIDQAQQAGAPRQVSQLKLEMQRVIDEEGALPLLGATHLIIDEAQDNDELQFALATLHAHSRVITTMIGDDDQTIYEWRRAMGYPGLMSFAQTFGAKVITLGENFRSVRTIVEHADMLIKHNNGHRVEKEFVSKRGAGGGIQVEKRLTEPELAAIAKGYIAEKSSPCADPSGKYTVQVSTGEFAILGRNNLILDEMECSLLSSGLKYVRQGKSILQKEPAQYVYDLIRGLKGYDLKGISFFLQIKGLSAAVADMVCREIAGRERDFVEGKMVNFAQFADSADLVKECSDWLVERGREQPPEVIAEVCSLVKGMFIPRGESDRKNNQNQKCVNVVQKCLLRMGGDLLFRVSLLQQIATNETLENAVCLMTFHGSKGLEFKHVIILGAGDSACPGKGELMSERRLFFVAVTRAKDYLLALYTGKPSRFLLEMGLV